METELFVHFAEIAGVFVGFGALIGLRSTRVTDLHDVVYLKSVLAVGVWVVIFALLPIVIDRYGVGDHALWLASAVPALVLWVVGVFGLNSMADWRAFNRSENLERVDRLFPVIGLPLQLILAGSLALIIIGLWPTLEEALYVTSLSAGIVMCGYALLVSVLSRPSASAAERDDA